MKSNYLKVFVTVTAALLLMGVKLYASETDKAIEANAYKSYVFKTYLKGDDIKIKAADGNVTLTGTVAEESHKLLALDTVGNLAEVKSVDNQLVTKAELASDNADTWIGRKVKLALLFHRNVSAGKTAVEVKDGVVTLTGEASSIAQKELTTEYVRDIDGVKELKNELTVVEAPENPALTTGEKIDDASITAQVKMALLTHRSTSSVKTAVKTRNGEVTLTGIAVNAAEISLVTKLVSDIQGVTGVQNKMTLQ